MKQRSTFRVEQRLVQFRSAGTSLVLDATGSGMPQILHWGCDLGALTSGDLDSIYATSLPNPVASGTDVPVPVTIVPEPGTGWSWTPGIQGHRAGADFSTGFVLTDWTVNTQPGVSGGSVRATLVDEPSGLALSLDIELTPSGLLRVRGRLGNTASASDYTLDSFALLFPLPDRANELLDFTGRHLRERAPQRHALATGVHRREGRRGRTGLDATLLLIAGVAGFGFDRGEVWAVHTAWSGNHLTLAERTSLGQVLIGGGELLLPGEITLRPGQSYESPWVVGAYSEQGLDGASARYHDFVRAQAHTRRTQRPVVMNTWEAVYFDQDLGKLIRLADLGAHVGAERFVLDDGWFRNRRDDTAGLGDWYVDEKVWPDGLGPIVDHVRALGMQFGLWVEPEMVNVDSDVVRAHPSWVMSNGYRLPPEARHQQVLDLANPDAYDYIFERLDALVSEYEIDYLKWDHNRDLVESGHPSTGRAGVHDQTTAAYRLMDALKERHPGLEIESCSSGGARADLEVLRHTDRIWTSDCIDSLERQHIQRWTSLLVPLEMIGAHVGAPKSHTTGRVHDLDFRAITALFGHFGIEWDLTTATSDDLSALASWVAVYKRFRALLHTGTLHRGEGPDAAFWVNSVVSVDRTEALVAFVAVASAQANPPGRVCLPGLDPDLRYRVEPINTTRSDGLPAEVGAPRWWAELPIVSGLVLAAVGIQAPALLPEHAVVLRLTAVRSPGLDDGFAVGAVEA